MNETKKLYILGGIVLVICILTVVVSIVGNKNKNANFSASSSEYVEKVDKVFTSETKEVIYIGRPTCPYCNLTMPILENLSEKYEFTYNYINIDETTSSDLNKILAYFEINSKDFGTPYIAIVENGEVIASKNGYAEEEVMFNFFKENSVIAKDAVYEETKEDYYNDLTYAQYSDLISKNENQLIVVVQTGCGYCTMQKEVLKDIYEKYGFKANFIDIKKLTTEERSLFNSSLDYYSSNELGTPLSLVVKNNKVVDTLSGHNEFDEYVEFLKENNLIGE